MVPKFLISTLLKQRNVTQVTLRHVMLIQSVTADMRQYNNDAYSLIIH
jgi:hypothetical protein